MSDLERFRKDQTSSPWAKALLVIPAGAGLAAMHLEMWVLMAVMMVIAVVGGVVTCRSARVHPRVENGEIKQGDYSALAMIGPFIPAIASLPIGSAIVDFSELPELVNALGVAGLQAVAFWFAVTRSEVQQFRIGKRRAARALESADLADATATRLDAVDNHRDLLAAALSTGAVDGIGVNVGSLAELTGREVDDALAAARELVSHDLMTIGHRPWEKKQEKLPVSVTPLGLQVMNEAGRR